MLLLITLYLALVILLPLALSAIVSYRTLPNGRACPLCRGDTFWVRRQWLGLISRLRPTQPLQQRWCPTCCWEGITRVERVAFEGWSWQPEVAESDASEAEVQTSTGAAPSAMRIRRLQVDGRSWSVMLQCWHRAETWYGKLLFVGPTGQRREDEVAVLNGLSPDDLLGQARALPEGMLAGRVRDLITD